MQKALVLDKRAGTLAIQVCRALARRGYQVDVLGTRGSIAFNSKYCAHGLELPVWDSEQVAAALKRIFAATHYDVIYLCNEEILAIIASLLESVPASLPIPRGPAIRTLLSKHETLARVRQEGVPAPLTIVPKDEQEAQQAARGMKLPFLIKGERGDTGKNLRVVTNLKSLAALYREMVRIEEPYAGRPALQQIIKGEAYSVGGLFHNGRPLRLCAHRKLLTYPRAGGVTVKGVTERPGRLLEETAKAFAAFQYTGLGHAEFIRDEREGDFKFIEINPRVWGSIGITEHAGVDLYRPYHELVAGGLVTEDLNYKEGIVYHRFSAEVQLIAERPARLPGFLKDAINPHVTSDFCWSDLGPYFAAIRSRRYNGDDAASSIQMIELDPAARE
jgi:biotin carboxylase